MILKEAFQLTQVSLSDAVPNKEPDDFTVVSETHNSASLSWKAIPHEHQRGFLTHYNLCSEKISSQDGKKGTKVVI